MLSWFRTVVDASASVCLSAVQALVAVVNVWAIPYRVPCEFFATRR